MGLKHLFLCIFAKAKYRLLSCVDQGSHSPESPIAAPLSQRGAVKSDEDNVVVNNRLLSSFHLRKINQPSLQPINPDNTVTLQAEDPLCVGPCSTLSGTQLPKPPNLHTDDATIALVPLLDKNPSVSVPWLQPRLLNRTLFDQCSSLLTIRASSWRKNFTLKSLISRALPHQDTAIDPCPSPHQDTREVIVNINAVFPLTGPESRNELLNQPLSPVNPARELSHKTLSEPPVNESDEVAVVIDTSKHRPRKDHPKTTGIDKEQIDRQYYKLKALPEIPQQETVNELEPEEVILYPRNDELEVLRRRFSSSPQVEESSKALSFLSTLPEMGHGPIVGGLLFRPPPTPQSLYPSNSLSFLTFECFPEKDPSAVIDCMPLEITQRGVQVASPYASASKLLPLESSFLLAAPGSEYSMWNSLFFSLDVYVKDGLKNQGKHINLHHDPWNIRFIGKGASGKVFCVGYKTEVRDPDSKIPGVPSVAFAKQSQVASVKVIDMRKQTLGTLEGLASEVVALKVLRNRREEVSKAKARGKRMRYSDGLHFLLESAYLPGIDDIAILRAERLYLLTVSGILFFLFILIVLRPKCPQKYYYCDLSNYGFKVSNDERSLSFILSELVSLNTGKAICYVQGLLMIDALGMHRHKDLTTSTISESCILTLNPPMSS